MVKEQVNIWLEEEEKRKLSDIAEKEKRSTSNMISYLIELGLTQYKKGVRL
jgi:predicted transcriptional regulator